MKDKNKKVNFVNRRSAHVSSSDYCLLAKAEDHGFIEVTEWQNGEGYDILLESKDLSSNKQISLTWGEFDAIKACIKSINKNYNYDKN